MWQSIHHELAPYGFEIIGIAVDEAASDVAPWIEVVTFPILLDRDRAFCDAYGVVNVPTVVWVDEDRQIVRPNEAAFGNDMFIAFHGVESEPHHAALRAWVREGVTPLTDEQLARRRRHINPDAHRARVEFRLGLEWLRRGDSFRAGEAVDRAAQLAPDDFTIRRAGLQLLGDDPFGPKFFEMYEDTKRRLGGEFYPGTS